MMNQSSRGIRTLVLGLLLAVLATPAALGSPLSGNPPIASIATTGYIDPTAASANSGAPLVACTSSCSTALINQNTDAMNWAIGQAASGSHPWINIPPGVYPYARGGSSHNQLYGVYFHDVSYVTVVGHAATFVQTGDLGGGQFNGWQLDDGSSHIRIIGLTFSQAGMTHTPVIEQTHNIEIGQTDNVDDVQVVDCAFIDGYGGDDLRMLGGISEPTVVTRISVVHNHFDAYRDGLSFQHGTSMVNDYNNYYDGDIPLHHEPTSAGGNNYENHIGNVFFNTAGGPQSIALGGNGIGNLNGVTDAAFAYNVVPDGYFFLSLEATGYWMIGNQFQTTDVSNNLVGLIEEFASNVWLDSNNFTQNDPSSQGVIVAEPDNGQPPDNFWFVNNRVANYSCGSASGCGAGFGATSVDPVWVEHNLFTYNSSASFSGTSGFAGIAVSSGGNAYGSAVTVYGIAGGWYTDNVIRRDVLADGVTQAGEMNSGIVVERASIGAGVQGIGHTTVRGNYIDGANQAYNPQSGTVLPEGLPVYTQNTLHSVTTEDAPPDYQITTTGATESLSASGTLNASREISVLNASSCGTDTFTLPDGTKGGFVKVIEAHWACATTQTVTPTHFGDGTSVTWSLTGPTGQPEVYVSLVWDDNSSVWRLLDTSSGVTVNP